MHFKHISLNIWGGKLLDNALDFLKKEQPDILSLQEVFHNPELKNNSQLESGLSKPTEDIPFVELKDLITGKITSGGEDFTYSLSLTASVFPQKGDKKEPMYSIDIDVTNSDGRCSNNSFSHKMKSRKKTVSHIGIALSGISIELKNGDISGKKTLIFAPPGKKFGGDYNEHKKFRAAAELAYKEIVRG